MGHLVTVVAGLTGAIWLAGHAHGLEPAALLAAIRCQVRTITIEQPAYMVVDAVVRGDRLLLPDYTNGLREIDLGTGSDLRSVLPMGSKRGQVTGILQLVAQNSRIFGSHLCSLPYFDVSGILAQDEDAANRVGIMTLDDRLVMFVNGEMVAELNDDSYGQGFFGVFINRDNTEELTINVDNVKYWLDPQEK